LLPSGGFSFCRLPTLALHRINSNSAGNYQLIDEESSRRISSADCQYLPSINSDSAGNYQLIDVESTIRMGFPPGITTSGKRNSPEESDSAGNNQLMEADSDRQDQNVRKILKVVTISGSVSTNHIYCEG
jgi:hypothetical protein